MPGIVEKAAAYAEAAHASIDQRRKYSGEPYIVHPRTVAELVATVTDDEQMLAAAWLHDVVEDTPVTLDQIVAEFGQDIAGLVADLTKPDSPEGSDRAQRKALERQHSASASPRAKTIKLADLLHNLSQVVEDDPRFARTYLAEKQLQLAVLTEGDARLYKQVEQVIREGKRKLGEL